MHNLCWDNCHSHVAWALRCMKYEGGSTVWQWNMVTMAMWAFATAKYTDTRGAVATWLPFAVVCVIVALWRSF
jgi:hypothetical protein